MTTAERRLSALEAGLTPTDRVRARLAEAHAHATFGAFFAAMHAGGVDALPLDQLAREAKTGAEAANRGRPREERNRAVRAALLGTVFRFQLVLRTIDLADQMIREEALYQAVIAGGLALLATADGKIPTAAVAGYEAGFGTLRNLARGRVFELHALAAARARVEGRYLDGAPILFPTTRIEWAEQVERSEHIQAAADTLAALDGFAPRNEPEDPSALEARVSQRVADHVEPALSKAHDEMGDGRRAAAIAFRWLAPSLGPSAG